MSQFRSVSLWNIGRYDVHESQGGVVWSGEQVNRSVAHGAWLSLFTIKQLQFVAQHEYAATNWKSKC